MRRAAAGNGEFVTLVVDSHLWVSPGSIRLNNLGEGGTAIAVTDEGGSVKVTASSGQG